MKNEYYHDIINILLEKGSDGDTARNIARLIYNHHYGLFEAEVVFHDIHHKVRVYLWNQSRKQGSPFMRIGWATYSLKPDFAVQLDFLDELYASEESAEILATTPAPETVSEKKWIQLTLF